MKELHGKVAVITGAASGFGREFAIRCADEGMKVVLTDIDTGGLGTTVALLKPGTESLVIGSDVSSADSIEHLARSTYDRFGACHLLFNNAGVGTAGPIWTATLDDWKWTLGINVMGVVHGLRSFVPRMLAQKEESYIVNTASAAGLLAPPGSGVYAASKHAVVAITECLHHELRGQNAPIGVSVLCPAFVDTGISNSERNRPAELADSNPEAEQYSDRIRQAIKSGKLSAADIARITIDAVKDGRFYILTHPNVKIAVEIKRLRLLHDLLPKAVRVGVLLNPGNPSVAEATLREVQEAAPAIGLQIQVLNASTIGEIDAAFAILARERPDALLVAADAFFLDRRMQFATSAAHDRIPAAYGVREFAAAGGLMSYGTNIVDAIRQVGVYTGRILKGAKPADLPVVQSTKFEFVINLQTARALGIEVPPGLLSIADEVIE